MRRVLNSRVVSMKEVPYESDETPGGKARIDILIVDDEQLIADTLGIILSRSGYIVRTAYDGSSALELARAHPPALLISDVVMPGMTGIELALSLELMVPECRILLFSGQAATVDLLDEARRMGHDFTILNKPVHPSDLLQHVSEYVRPVREASHAMVN